jgi:hypothetical protein
MRQIGLHHSSHRLDRRDAAAHQVGERRRVDERFLCDERPYVVTGSENVRPSVRALFDQLTQPDVDVMRDPRTTRRRHTALERRAERTTVGDVHVRVDETGQDVAIPNIDRLHARGRRRSTNRLYAAAAQDHSDTPL